MAARIKKEYGAQVMPLDNAPQHDNPCGVVLRFVRTHSEKLESRPVEYLPLDCEARYLASKKTFADVKPCAFALRDPARRIVARSEFPADATPAQMAYIVAAFYRTFNWTVDLAADVQPLPTADDVRTIVQTLPAPVFKSKPTVPETSRPNRNEVGLVISAPIGAEIKNFQAAEVGVLTSTDTSPRPGPKRLALSPEERRARRKAYRSTPEYKQRKNEHQRQWNRENPDYQRQWIAEHPDYFAKRREWQREWRKANPETAEQRAARVTLIRERRHANREIYNAKRRAKYAAKKESSNAES